MRDRRADEPPEPLIFGLNHDDDGVMRIFIRRKRCEPIIPAGQFGCVHSSPAPCRSCRKSAGRARPPRVPVPSASSVSASIASCKIFRLRGCTPNSVAHEAGRKIRRRFAARRVLRFNAFNEPRPENCSAIGDGGIGTAICIGVTAISPWPKQMFAESPSRQSDAVHLVKRRENSLRFLPRRQIRCVRQNEISPPSRTIFSMPVRRPIVMK